MTQSNNLTLEFFLTPALARRMLIGAGIGLTLMAFFLIKAGDGNPEWPRYWFIRPLVVETLAGAAGGAFYSFLDVWRQHGGVRKVLANVLGVIVFIIGMWMGFVLGLDGTYWN